MANKTIRIEIPVGNPGALQTLAGKILTRHADLGAGSPLLTFVDMVLFQNQLTLSSTSRNLSQQRDADGQADTQAADVAMGVHEGQSMDTPGTVYHLTDRVRKRLLFVHDGAEEELSRYGFNVVISGSGSSKTVSVDIPIGNLQDMTNLVQKIIDRHVALAASSPLPPVVDMPLLISQFQLSTSKRTSAQKAHAHAEALMQKANKALGTDKGQTAKTMGTVYYLILRVRDHLLLAHDGLEEELSTYGFNVVITEGNDGSVPPTGTFTANPPSIIAGGSSTLSRNISGSVSQTIDNGIGAVSAVGTTQVTPAVTTTYTLRAVAEDESTLTITAPVSVGDAPPPPIP